MLSLVTTSAKEPTFSGRGSGAKPFLWQMSHFAASPPAANRGTKVPDKGIPEAGSAKSLRRMPRRRKASPVGPCLKSRPAGLRYTPLAWRSSQAMEVAFSPLAVAGLD